MPGLDNGFFGVLGSNTNDAFPASTPTSAIKQKVEQQHTAFTPEAKLEAKAESDEEL